VQNVVRTHARTHERTNARTHARTHPSQRGSYHGSLTRGLRGALQVGTRPAGVEDMAWLSRATVRLHEPFYDDKSLTLLAACNVEGFVMPACYVAEETIDSEAFVAWVGHYLCPRLGKYAMA
jgi:hypothetical protein